MSDLELSYGGAFTSVGLGILRVSNAFKSYMAFVIRYLLTVSVIFAMHDVRAELWAPGFVYYVHLQSKMGCNHESVASRTNVQQST